MRCAGQIIGPELIVLSSLIHRIAFANTSSDKFTSARALVAPLTLSDAMLRKGRLLSGGLSSMLKNETVAVMTVTTLYVRSKSNILHLESSVLIPLSSLFRHNFLLLLQPRSISSLPPFPSAGSFPYTPSASGWILSSRMPLLVSVHQSQ